MFIVARDGAIDQLMSIEMLGAEFVLGEISAEADVQSRRCLPCTAERDFHRFFFQKRRDHSKRAWSRDGVDECEHREKIGRIVDVTGGQSFREVRKIFVVWSR